MSETPPPNNNNNKNNKNPFSENRFGIFILAGIILLVLLLFSLINSNSFLEKLPYSDFMRQVEDGLINSVEIVDGTSLRGTGLVNGLPQTVITKIPYTDLNLVDRLLKAGINFTGVESKMRFGQMIFQSIPWIILILIMFSMFRTMNGSSKAFSFGKNRARKYEHDAGKGITFKDVAGQEEAKYELQEVVSFLKSPENFQEIGARIPRGVLLVGSPGTGKTLLARAVAGEAEVAFFHMSGSDFVEMFVGVGASRVRDLFEQGRKNSPCIIFIDEIDAVGRTRGSGMGGGHDEREQTLNQMLVEMDGFETKQGVIVMAATNRVDVLDPALLRPGRFDRQINVVLPDVKEREKILEIHSIKIKTEENIDFPALARRTPGCSGADLANIVNEAALFAARHSRKLVGLEDFEEARDKVLMGLARHTMFMTEKEKKLTAYHESGHTLVSLFSEGHNFEKVTIIPRGQALGVTMFTQSEESYAPTYSVLRARIQVAFGGYVAEEMIFGETTIGTSNDLKQATDLAHRMVTEWGMSSLGAVSYADEQPIFIGREISRAKEFSETTSTRIDQAVREILNECLENTRILLRQRKEDLVVLSETLLEKETMYKEEIEELLKLSPKNPEKEVAEAVVGEDSAKSEAVYSG
ncbi:ATP-dependent zinc metalloprotease FtsH [Candidatus Haliotispira prima]|uniref:ATP-dependent zinc metalloprotease FtsH n=1 Tax=Candidatus Haliotispira prima TaxID=3034016 RepID=A0ABY8MIB3_9SPIO|nr:ATP-dependent zinc metalloprotease FtsH [Candidatus Haliotispira prima]